MEELNKSQLILLAILVSFVTSIATGVLTISLLSDEPQTVTQTINRVVERTVETVVPGETRTVVREVPVIVTEEDLIIKVINIGAAAVGPISNAANLEQKVGLAFILDGGKLAVTAAAPLGGEAARGAGPFAISLDDGTKITGQVAAVSGDGQVAVLKITRIDAPVSGGKSLISDLLTNPPALKGVKFSTVEPAVGQTVVAVGTTATDGSPVAVGIVSSLIKAENGTTTIGLKTNAATKDNVGGPLFSIQGEVAGLNLSPGTAVSARLIKTLVDSVK